MRCHAIVIQKDTLYGRWSRSSLTDDEFDALFRCVKNGLNKKVLVHMDRNSRFRISIYKPCRTRIERRRIVLGISMSNIHAEIDVLGFFSDLFHSRKKCVKGYIHAVYSFTLIPGEYAIDMLAFMHFKYRLRKYIVCSCYKEENRKKLTVYNF